MINSSVISAFSTENFYLVEKQKIVKKIQESLKHVMSLTYANNDK